VGTDVGNGGGECLKMFEKGKKTQKKQTGIVYSENL
jgi:hypothetical protein